MKELIINNITYVLSLHKNQEHLRISREEQDGSLTWIQAYEIYDLQAGRINVDEFIQMALDFFNELMGKYFKEEKPEQDIWKDLEEAIQYVEFDGEKLVYNKELDNS